MSRFSKLLKVNCSVRKRTDVSRFCYIGTFLKIASQIPQRRSRNVQRIDDYHLFRGGL